ncbi:MAG: rRNA maturation RNase YbeY [Boseongicola sp. SB0662_bin_57]|nr:rRNA maturation RNase YbeY [Boseongicola sp. SB0662_bin_57]
MTTDVIAEDPRWRGTGVEALASRAVKAALEHVDLDPGDWNVTILACDAARIAALNARFRGTPMPTNVLSWPSAERAAAERGERPAPPAGDSELGDIAISFETCLAEAREGGVPLEAHVLHLVVHATLHLLGYGHDDDSDADLMEATETAILQSLGASDAHSRKETGDRP